MTHDTEKQTIQVRVKRELFRFTSQQDWINRARRAYANCGVSQGFYISIDANGHVMHKGLCFMAAENTHAYPVTVYELQTNWEGGAA